MSLLRSLMMLFHKLIESIKSNKIQLSESCIEDIKKTILQLKLEWMQRSDIDPFDIIENFLLYGQESINEKSVLALINELLEEYELKGYECFENDDGTLDCSELDNPLINLLSKHFTNIELTRLLGQINEKEKA